MQQKYNVLQYCMDIEKVVKQNHQCLFTFQVDRIYDGKFLVFNKISAIFSTKVD